MELVRDKMSEVIIREQIDESKIVGYGRKRIPGLFFHTLINGAIFYYTFIKLPKYLLKRKLAAKS
jgi:hypothetical protein